QLFTEQTGNVDENKGQGKKVEELRVESQEVECRSNVDRSPGARSLPLPALDSPLLTTENEGTVRRDSAVKLVDVLAGASPASADCPVGTVVISGGGAGDQTVGSPEVNALSMAGCESSLLRQGGQAKQQVVAQANRS